MNTCEWRPSTGLRRTQGWGFTSHRWLVINYPHKSFNNFHSQALEFRWATMDGTINRTICDTLTILLQTLQQFPCSWKNVKHFSFSSRIISLHKKQISSLLLFLIRCKLSYFICHWCLNFRLKMDITTWCPVSPLDGLFAWRVFFLLTSCNSIFSIYILSYIYINHIKMHVSTSTLTQHGSLPIGV